MNGEELRALSLQSSPVGAQDRGKLAIDSFKHCGHVVFEERASTGAESEVISELQSEPNFFKISQMLDL